MGRTPARASVKLSCPQPAGRGGGVRAKPSNRFIGSSRLWEACRGRGNACIAPTEQPEQGSRPQVQHMSQGSFFLYPLSGGVPRSGGVGFTDGRSRNPPRPYGPPLQGGDNKTFRWGGVGHERRGGAPGGRASSPPGGQDGHGPRKRGGLQRAGMCLVGATPCGCPSS